VFRSERDGGGLFVASVDGGAERQISSFGLYPLWLKSTTEILFRAGLAEYPTNVYVVSPDGGHAPEELVRDFVRGGAWNWAAPHPDGRVSVIGLHPDRRFGFYTVSRDSRHVTVSKIPEDFPLQFTETDTRLLRFQWNPSGDALFVEAILNEVRNVWKIRVEPRTLEWIDAERLTVGSGPDKAASLSGDGSRIVYTALQETIRLWSLPFDATSGRITGKGAPITPEGRRVETFVLSPDGSFVAYSARAAGSQRTEMLLFDINGGKTEVFALNASPGAWAPDSRTLAYSLSRPDVLPPGEWALAVRQVGGAERIVRRWNTQSVFLPSGWTIDGRFILGSYLSPLYTGQPKLALWPNAPAEDGSERILVSDPESRPWQASFSPNGRWLAFVIEPTKTRVNTRVVVTPAAGAPPAQWTHVVGVDEWVDKPRWAPDGRALYFLSNGGSSFFNLWGIRFDADRGMPVGEPFPITKFDSPGLIIAPNISSTELGIAHKRAVVTMTTLAGSIWMLGNVDR
jgi:Tol biopolymer transport system component